MNFITRYAIEREDLPQEDAPDEECGWYVITSSSEPGAEDHCREYLEQVRQRYPDRIFRLVARFETEYTEIPAPLNEEFEE